MKIQFKSIVERSALALLLTLSFSFSATAQNAPAQTYITMHSAPIDDYCGPCITSERLLKEAKLEYRKILEPLGPWPWFKFTDAQGNQSTVRGGLNENDIQLANKGELPKDR